MKNNNKQIELLNARYINKEYDIAIIEVKGNYNVNYLEIDDMIYENTSELLSKESIYIIQHKNKNDALVSFGVLTNIFNSTIRFICNINQNSKSSPILNISNNKLIGLTCHSNSANKAIILKFIVNEFISRYKDKNFKNEIDILLRIEKMDCNNNKKIYFLDNYEKRR